MKKVIAIIALIIVPAISFAQSVFDKLEDMDEVSSIVINKDAFEILSKFNPDAGDGNGAMEAFKMLNELNELKMFSTEDIATSKIIEKMIKDEVKSSKLTELMRGKDKGSSFKIYFKGSKNKDKVKEVLMFMNELGSKTNMQINTVVVSLTGNIDLNKLTDVADKLTKAN